jgi:FkbM family methyltransferase
MSDYYTERKGLMMFRPFDAGDKMVYNQIFVNEELKPLTGIDNVNLIVDCGAHIGMSGRYLKWHYPNSDILLFEPAKSNFEILQENFPDTIKNGMAQALNLAVWSHEVSLGITESEKSTAFRCYLGGNEVEALSLDFVFETYDKIDILKMDVEGAEKYIFSRNTGWIAKTRNIAIEIHKGCEDAVFDEMDKYNYELMKSGEYIIFKNIGSK